MELLLTIGGILLVIYVVAKANASPPAPTFDVRLQDAQIDIDDRSISAKEVQARGLFPLTETKNLGAWISILDESSENTSPVLCVIERFQEEVSRAYFVGCEFGAVAPSYAIPEWTRIGVLFPEIMQPPHSGQRDLSVMVRLVDLSEPPTVNLGFLRSGEAKVLWKKKLKFTHHFAEKGWQEIAKHRDEAQILTLKIAVTVAMSDGSLDEQEGLLMKSWIKQSIAPLSGVKEEGMKKAFNAALRESYEKAKSGSLDLQALAERLNEIGELSNKYHALELSADIMAVDGVAHVDEIAILDELAKLLDLDVKRVAEILDTRFIKLDPDRLEEKNVETMIGIKPDWTEERIKKHLRSEFNKWNNRLNTLSEGQERDNAQRMLDFIADVRKKHVR